MTQPPSTSGRLSPAPEQERSPGDPWHAFGYLVAGVGLYGFLGHLGDGWLGTSFLVVVGILVGAGLGIYLTFSRFNRAPADHRPPRQSHE